MEKLYEQILSILNEDCRTSHDTIADMLGAKPKEVSAAISDMEKKGIILKYKPVLNEEKLERDDVQAWIEVRVSPQKNRGFDAIAEEIYQFDEVKTIFLMSGDYDLAILVQGKTLRAVTGFVSEKLSALGSVLSTATHFVLKKYKSDGIIIERFDKEKRLAMHE